VNAHPDKQISQTDPDARLMKTHHIERQVCYNVQSAVDTKHHLIVAHDIVMTTDRGQLTLVAEQVQVTWDKKDITIIADKGYFSRIDIKATQDLDMTVNIPQIDTSGAAKKRHIQQIVIQIRQRKRHVYVPCGRGITPSTWRDRKRS
jgi:NAD-dependent oxidoreductase involved in siderophore biosynthesis